MTPPTTPPGEGVNYDTLPKSDLAKATRDSFGIGYNTCISFTIESMKSALKANDSTLLRTKEGNGPTTINGGNNLSSMLGQLGGIIDASIDSKLATLSPSVSPELVATLVEDAISRHQGRIVTLVSPEGIKYEAGLQHEQFPILARLLNLRLNVWAAGPSGTGKTRGAHEVAKATNRKFYRISCGPQTTASSIFGHTTATGGYAAGPAYLALKEGGCVLLFDECDHLMGGVATMVNGLLDGAPVTFPNGETLEQPKDCSIMVAANTFGAPTPDYPNAQKFSPATRNRFVQLHWDYDPKLETSLYATSPAMKTWVKYCHKVRAAVKEVGVRNLAVTMRSMENAAALFSDGFTPQDAAELLLYNGLPVDDKSKIVNKCGMPA